MTYSEKLDWMRDYVLGTIQCLSARTIEQNDAVATEVEAILTDPSVPWYLLIELYYLFDTATSSPGRASDWPLVISLLDQNERLQKIVQADKKWMALVKPCSRRDQ